MTLTHDAAGLAAFAVALRTRVFLVAVAVVATGFFASSVASMMTT